MKELWSRTFELFRRRIVLWVPCSVAAILMLALGKLEKAEIHWLYGFFATRHSVLGGDVPVADLAQAQHRAMMLIFPLGFVKEFLEVGLFVVALAATKNLVCMILKEQRPDTITAVRGILPRSREILLLSFKYMAVLLVFGGVLIFVGSSPLTPNRIHEFFLSKTVVYVLGLVCQGCLAWLLMPAAIRLLRSPDNPTISVQGRKMGTVFAVATSAGALALEYLVGKVETVVVIEEQWEGLAIAVVNTIVINTPEVLLFIALSLLAIQEFGNDRLLAPESELNGRSRLFGWVRRAREWRGGPI